MKILVANLGSTSFKYRLFDLPAETQLARGGIERIGDTQSQWFVEIGDHQEEGAGSVPDHATAVQLCLDQLTDTNTGCVTSVREVSGIGFKAVCAGSLSGVRLVDESLLTKMEELADVAPAHNPPYAKAMRELNAAFPEIPLIAALETGFHETIPAENRVYAVPYEWRERYDIQRWGYHGASHRYISQRISEMTGQNSLRLISCHLGGSSSLCAIKDGQSIATTMGMSPQSGLPQNNRVGDFDPFALPILMRATGKSLEDLLSDLATQSGLKGLSGISGDLRDLEAAADAGNERASLAVDTYVASIRHHIGAYMVQLGGLDTMVFTGGIGENSQRIRSGVCQNLEWANIQLDVELNKSVTGETKISTPGSAIEIWVVPTNEEIVVARQTAERISQT